MKEGTVKSLLVNTMSKLTEEAIKNNVSIYIQLKDILKACNAESDGAKAAIRGLLNRDILNGGILFERKTAIEGRKTSGSYKLKEQIIKNEEKQVV